jgi:hypothetical protein
MEGASVYVRQARGTVLGPRPRFGMKGDKCFLAAIIDFV